MKPTYDELFGLVQALSKQCFEYQQTIKHLEKRIADLESQLKKNSKNSSKPPSSDQKPNLPPIQKKERRPFHPGASRQLLPESEVSSRIERRIEACPRCHSTMEATGKIVKWQQIELPEIRPLVCQWELHECSCPNCKLVITPELEENERYLLGPRLEAFANLCLGRFRMGHRIVREFIATLLPGIDLSQGLISKIKRRAAEALAGSRQKILEKIITEEKPIHVDATSWRHMCRNEHAVVMRTDKYVVFTFIKHQNKAAFKDLLWHC